ncbi:phage tail protein [Jeotgalibacillus aurantiacus]|uniref:phage tail protein n=1 Tax=Jeotgalibacillus aurantiacus TaxID=2763266 RepID=UPI001D0B97F0|nr:tail fiber protein [Jeotgalibacillus aurantiacus]
MNSYLGEIKIFSGTYAPQGWAFCDGSPLNVNQYQGLFSVIGSVYGGDSRTYFNLPDLRDRVPVQQGQATGGTIYWKIGDKKGDPTVTLNESQTPLHNHIPQSSASTTGVSSPEQAIWCTESGRSRKPYKSGTDTKVSMKADALNPVGGNQPHNNQQPYLALNYIICIDDGIYPIREQ